MTGSCRIFVDSLKNFYRRKTLHKLSAQLGLLLMFRATVFCFLSRRSFPRPFLSVLFIGILLVEQICAPPAVTQLEDRCCEKKMSKECGLMQICFFILLAGKLVQSSHARMTKVARSLRIFANTLSNSYLLLLDRLTLLINSWIRLDSSKFAVAVSTLFIFRIC